MKKSPVVRILCCFLLVGWGVSLQPSIRGKALSSALFSIISSNEGKLFILQDVVKELKARNEQLLETSQESKETFEEQRKALEIDLVSSKESNELQETTIRNLRTQLTTMEESHSRAIQELKDKHQQGITEEDSSSKLDILQEEYQTSLERLQSKLQSKENNRRELQEQLDKITKEHKETLEKLHATISHLETTLQQSTTDQNHDSERLRQEHAKTLASLKENHQENMKVLVEEHTKALESLKEDHQETLQGLEDKLHTIAKENEGLNRNLSEMALQTEEQVEIATAAVKAGEKREEDLKTNANRLAEQLEKRRVQTLILRLSLQGFVDENKACAQNEKALREHSKELQSDLETCQSRIRELEENQQRTLWQRIKTKFSSMR